MKRKVRVIKICLASLVLVLLTLAAIPNFLPARHKPSLSSCVAHLKQIAGAKASWAHEHKKGPDDVPAESDLFGKDAYIYEKPECPARGVYKLGRVSEKVVCSFAAHNEI